MNKKILISGLLVGLFAIIVGLFVYKLLNKKEPHSFAQELPLFEAITLDGIVFNTDSLSAGKVVVVFYSPGCLFCEHEGKELSRHANEFTDCRLLFITNAPIDSAVAYTSRTGVGKIAHFRSLVDTTLKTPLLFGLRTLPTTFIFGDDRQLINAFEGEVNAKKLLKTIRQHEKSKE
ncbi:MAG: redoxin domain-containing protein [Prevotellaceae bacterium]|jgi:peroxiredoxin|nr:redoxin domain-containing protein [Prevotellaceae bacterium]